MRCVIQPVFRKRNLFTSLRWLNIFHYKEPAKENISKARPIITFLFKDVRPSANAMRVERIPCWKPVIQRKDSINRMHSYAISFRLGDSFRIIRPWLLSCVQHTERILCPISTRWQSEHKAPLSNEQLSGPSIRIDRSMIAAKLDESLTTVIRFSIAIHRLLVEFRDLQQAARGAGQAGQESDEQLEKKTTPITIKTEVLVEPPCCASSVRTFRIEY